MMLMDHVVRNFKVTKLFRENTDTVNSFDFSSDGYRIISCGKDDQIVIYDCEKGEVMKKINTKKYGADIISFAQTNTSAIHTSTKVDNTIRHLSLNDNKYIRYFVGHTKKVVTLSVSPPENLIVSGSLDKTLKLWDIRSPKCRGYVNVQGSPVAAIDPNGLVMAVGVNSETLSLFDIRSFGKSPFITRKIQHEQKYDWTNLKFSPNGNIILLSTNGSLIRLLDAYTGLPTQILTGQLNNERIPIEASFSPDALYIFSGSIDGHVHAWNIVTGYKVCTLKGDHPGPVACIKFNPKYKMMASACTNMTFWLPSLVDI